MLKDIVEVVSIICNVTLTKRLALNIIKTKIEECFSTLLLSNRTDVELLDDNKRPVSNHRSLQPHSIEVETIYKRN